MARVQDPTGASLGTLGRLAGLNGAGDVGDARGEHPPAFEIPYAPKLKAPEAEAIVKRLGFGPLRNSIAHMSAARVAQAVQRTEARQGQVASPEWIDTLMNAKAGTTIWPPINMIRPGQAEMSFVNTRQKALDFVARIEARRDTGGDRPRTLLGHEEALTAVVGPGGKYLVLTDGHHHIAALKAVQDVVDGVIGDSLSRSPTANAKKPAGEIKFVQDLFGGPGGIPNVPIVVTHNYSELGEKEFWQILERDRLTYRPNGVRVPSTFGALPDNPWRYLASITTGKVHLPEQDRSVWMGGAQNPVWLKFIDHAPTFVEFEIGEIYRRAFAQLGLRYDPERPLTKEMRDVCRAALLFARADPNHPSRDLLRAVPIVVKELPRRLIEAAIERTLNGTLEIPKRFTKPGRRRLERLDVAMAEIARARHRARLPLPGGPADAKKQWSMVSVEWSIR